MAAEGLGAPAAPGDALSPLVVLMLGLVLLVVLAFVAKLGFDLRSLSRSLEGGCGGRGEVAQPAREPIVPGPEPGPEGDTTRAEGFEPLLRDAFAALLADAARAPTLAPLRELLLGLERSDASGRPGALVRVELGPGSALHLADGSLLRGSQEWPAVELWVEHGPLGSPIVVRPAGAGLPPVALRSIERPAELRFRLAARE